MFKAIIIPVLLSLLSILFLLACIGERTYQNKVLYAAVAGVLLALLLISTNI